MIFLGLVQSLNTDCGAIELARLGMRREVKMRRGWEREVRKWKILSKKLSEKWSVTGEAPTVITSLRWMGQCTGEGAHWDNLFTGLPLSHGWWVLKIDEMCFHFPSSSLIFLSNKITKHESWSPNKMFSVSPISFGSWVMKTGSYHSKLTTSKHALNVSYWF